MRFIWDDVKNRTNRVKHCVSFEIASLVFADPLHISVLDRIENGEERWQTLGMAGGVVVLLVAHTFMEEGGKRLSESSRPARQPGKRGNDMKKSTEKQAKELADLAALPDDEIDTSDIPEINDWEKAVVGRFYRPIKQAVTIRLDADVLDWLKKGGKGYQTKVNKILRAVMEQQRKKTAA